MSRYGGITVDVSGALDVADRLFATVKRADQAQRRALGTLRRRLPVQARRDIQAEYAIKAATLRERLLTRTDTAGLRLIGKSRGMGLINFGARQTRAGVSSQVLRGERDVDAGAFLAPLIGNNLHAVERYGAKRRMTRGHYIGQLRQPLSVLYGPSVAQMLQKGRRLDRLAEFAQRVIAAELERLASTT